MVQFATAAVVSFALGVSALAVGDQTKRDTSVARRWAGWENIKNAFIFGDSYTQTGFDYTQAQPSASNPLGNPPYPGWTSSNGPNWVGYLTFKYNASALLTYNFAYGGATVDADLVTPYTPTVKSVKDQVESQFIPGYTGGSPRATWTGDDSVFAIWIGINDIGNSYWNGADQTDVLNGKIFDVLSGLVDQIYDAGGRNYVLINVPPLERAPLTALQGEWAITTEKADVEAWNQKVVDLAGTLKDKGDTSVWVYDTYASFGEVMDDPASHVESSGLQNTTDFCAAYQNGTPAQDTLDPSCGVPVNQYFWLNNLHPTSAIHEVVAKGISDLLAAGPNV